jgi:hypothetical protein
MRIARKLMLLAITAFAAMAFAASSAQATENLEIIDEGTATHCSAWVEGNPAGGCKWHAEGEVRLFGHFFGIESTEARCHIEIEGRVDETGDGEINSVVVTNGGHGETNCATVSPPCNLPHWVGRIEETGPGAEQLSGYVCFDPTETGARCEGTLTVPIFEVGTSPETQHLTVLDTKPLNSGAFCELDFDVETETDATHPGMHLRHI